MKAIFLIAGHGRSANGAEDNGASFNNTTEYKEVVEIVSEAETSLIANKKFTKYKVRRVKEDKDGIVVAKQELVNPDKIQVVAIGHDRRLSLRDKITAVNDICVQQGWTEKDCILISVHINAANKNASGIEVWHETKSKQSKSLAKELMDKLEASTGFKRRGTKDDATNRHGRLGIIRDTMPVAVLGEFGFITNDMDSLVLKDPEADDVFAEGIYDAVISICKVTDKTKSPPAFYEDVPQDVWYYPYVKLLLDEGYLTMPSHGRFKPTEARVTNAVLMARHITKEHGKTLPVV